MSNGILNNFLFVRERDKSFDKYQMVPELTLSFMISGKKELRFANQVINGQAGNIGLIRKNELLKSIQMKDEDGQDYESISIFFRLTSFVLMLFKTTSKLKKSIKAIHTLT